MKRKVLTIIEFIFIILSMCFSRMINLNTIELYLFIPLIIILFKVTKDFKQDKTTIVFSSIFSFLISFGNLDNNSFHINKYLIILIEFLGFYFIFSKLFLLLKDSLKKINIDKNNKKISSLKFILISSIIGFIILLPYFLKYYPGILTIDSMKQMWQVTGYTNYSNHHPWIHTLLIKLLYNIGYGITKSPNFGVATYTLFQMIITCITFSYVIYILYKNNFNKLIVIIVWIFFFLFPFNAIYTITMWKDIPFSLIILAITTFIYDHYKNNGEYNLNKQITITTLSILMCLFRSNGFIAYFIFIIVLFILSKKDFIKLKYSILITIIVVFIFKGPIMNYFNVESSEFIESLSIPVQQIGYVIKNNGNLSNKDLEELNKFVDIKKIHKDSKLDINYRVSDEMKKNFNNANYINIHKLEFFKLWAHIGIKNIDSYITAYILQTNGYWYHNYGEYWIYANSITNYPDIISIDDELHQTNFLPKFMSKIIDNLLDITSSIYYKVYSPAITTYILLIGLYITIEKKKNIIPFIIPIAITLTLLIATPVACEFRYAYSVFLTAPFLLLGALINKGGTNEN